MEQHVKWIRCFKRQRLHAHVPEVAPARSWDTAAAGPLSRSLVSWHSSSFGRLCCVTSIYSRGSYCSGFGNRDNSAPFSKKRLKISRWRRTGHSSSHVTSSPHPTGPACLHDPCASKSCSERVCILRGSRTAGGLSRFEPQGCAVDGTADSPELWRAATSASMWE